MSRPNNYNDKMHDMADEELYEISVHDKNYVPEAVRVAKHELETRNIAPERMAKIQDVLKQKDEKDMALASIPLRGYVQVTV